MENEESKRFHDRFLELRLFEYNNISTHRDFVAHGEFYHIEDDDKPSYGTLGFGGRKFVIEFDDGHKIVTHNLWHRGRVPDEYLDRLKDNAKFIF